MTSPSFEYRFRPAYQVPERMGRGPVDTSTRLVDHMIVEHDVPVPLRDGTIIYVDVHRPDIEAVVPALIAWSPYGKHGHVSYDDFPGSEVDASRLSEFTAFEGPDPLYWTAHGYAVINADPRGLWRSQGRATYCSPEEAQDYHDLIEWAGEQPWSNGRVGLTGVSYLAVSQWQVAATRPPHLCAINPWEGWSDLYREVVRHGGIPETKFWPFLVRTWGFAEGEVEDLMVESRSREFMDAYWASKRPDVAAIEVPAFVVACWADQGLHLRGTLDAFSRLQTEQKQLEVHGGKKWAYYYDESNVERLRTFFDEHLRGTERSANDRPAVRLEIRETREVSTWIDATSWPSPEVARSELFLDAARGSLQEVPPTVPSQCGYDSLGSGHGPHRALFDHEFAQDVAIVGSMRLQVWMEIEEGDDADVFVAVQKFDRNGDYVPFPFYGQFDDGPVALGWLRASHRELDEAASTDERPVLLHQRRLPVIPGEPLRLDVEVLPSGTRFRAGDRLRLVAQGTDIYRYGKRWRVQPLHEDSVNFGPHRILSGPEHPSRLIFTVLPEQ